MNYYEKLIQQKNNARDYDDINKVYKEAKRIVDDLRRKYREISGRERDDGNFLYSIIEEKGMPTDSGDQQKAKHAAGLLESVRRMSTAPRDWGNSKGETDMGYYADLIKEKKEKKNGLGSRHGNVVKEFKYKGCDIAILRGYSSGPYDGTSSYGADVYKGDLRLGLDDIFYSQARAEADAKLAVDMFLRSHKNNSKEEKRNSAESHLKGLIGKKFKRDTDLERAVNSSIYTEISDWSHPRMVVFDKYTDEKYILTTEDNNQYGKDQEFWISKVQKANSKEEKDNDAEGRLMEIAEKVLREYPESTKSYAKFEDRFLTKAGWGYNPSKVKTIKEIWERVANSKEEKDNDKVVEKYTRNGAEIEILETESGNYRSRVHKGGTTKEITTTAKSISEARKDAEEYARTMGNEKEEGYYAKLAEEKAERKNYKFTDKEISDYLKSNPSQAKQYVRKKTAGKAENITIHPETLTAELDENGKTHLFKFVSDESLGFILKYMGTK